MCDVSKPNEPTNDGISIGEVIRDDDDQHREPDEYGSQPLLEPASSSSSSAIDADGSGSEDFFTLRAYLRRCCGAGAPSPSWFGFDWDVLPACLFSWVTLVTLATIESYWLQPYGDGLLAILPSFGASSTLVYCFYTTTGAQPRGLLLTHICGAFLGISCAHITKAIGIESQLSILVACAVAVAINTAVMMVFNCFQPSASATTSLAALHPYGKIHDQGYMFLVTPATIGPVVITIFACIFNNFIPWRPAYPVWW